jgi:hypothetical protein
LQVKKSTKKAFDIIIMNNIIIDPSKIITIPTSSSHAIKKKESPAIKCNDLSRFILSNQINKSTKSKSFE